MNRIKYIPGTIVEIVLMILLQIVAAVFCGLLLIAEWLGIEV